MRHPLSLLVRYSFCIANIQLQYRPCIQWHCFLLREFLRILAKSRISEEFLVENFGPPSTFQEFSSWIHPWQKIFQEMFAYIRRKWLFSQHLKKEKNRLNFLYYGSHAPVEMQGYRPCTCQHGKNSKEVFRILKKNFQRQLYNSWEFSRILETSWEFLPCWFVQSL